MRNYNLLSPARAKAFSPFTKQVGSVATNNLILLCLMVTLAIGTPFLINFLNNFARFSYIKFSALLLLCCFGFYMLSRPNILFFTRTLLLILIPIISISVPPKRLQLSLFSILLIIYFFVLLHNVFWKKKTIKLIPDKFAFILLISALPSVFLGISPLHSTIIYLKNISLNYLFFIIMYDYLSEKGAFTDIVKYLAVALLFISLAIFFEFLTGINLSGSGKNLYELKGVTRCAGFFQDSQKAGQFLAVGITFFTLLLCRNVPLGRKIIRLVRLSVFVSCVALLLTVSKNAIITGFLFPIIGILFFGQNNQMKKQLLFLFVPLLLFILLVFQDEITSIVLESSVGTRMVDVDRSAVTRLMIWDESWQVFKQGNIITGIGPGNYQELLMRADPDLRVLKAAGGYVPQQPESGYLKIIYETGIFGLGGFVLFFIGTTVKMAKCLLASYKTDSTGTVVSASFAIVAFSFGFVTLFTTTDSRNSMFFLIMYALLSFFHKNNYRLNSKQYT